MTTALGADEPENGARSQPNPWATIVGPCYSRRSMERELGLEPAALADAVKDLRALQLNTSDRVAVFPAWQVVDGALVPGLRSVLIELRAGVDSPWTWAQWLGVRPRERERSRLDALLTGDIDAVVVEARHAAATWKQ